MERLDDDINEDEKLHLVIGDLRGNSNTGTGDTVERMARARAREETQKNQEELSGGRMSRMWQGVKRAVTQGFLEASVFDRQKEDLLTGRTSIFAPQGVGESITPEDEQRIRQELVEYIATEAGLKQQGLSEIQVNEVGNERIKSEIGRILAAGVVGLINRTPDVSHDSIRNQLLEFVNQHLSQGAEGNVNALMVDNIVSTIDTLVRRVGILEGQQQSEDSVREYIKERLVLSFTRDSRIHSALTQERLSTVDKLMRTKLGQLLPTPVIYAATTVAVVAARSKSRAGAAAAAGSSVAEDQVIAAAAAATGAGAAVAATFGAVRESGRLKAERAQVSRDAALGREGLVDDKRREALLRYSYDTIPATQIIGELTQIRDAIQLTPEYTSQCAAHIARTMIAVETRKDLTIFDSEQTVHVQRLEIAKLIAQITARMEPADLTALQTAITQAKQEMYEDIKNKDKDFNKYRRKRSLRQAGIGGLTSLTFGLVTSEVLESDMVSRLFNRAKDTITGLTRGLFSNMPADAVTPLAWLKEYVFGSPEDNPIETGPTQMNTPTVEEPVYGDKTMSQYFGEYQIPPSSGIEKGTFETTGYYHNDTISPIGDKNELRLDLLVDNGQVSGASIERMLDANMVRDGSMMNGEKLNIREAIDRGTIYLAVSPDGFNGFDKDITDAADKFTNAIFIPVNADGTIDIPDDLRSDLFGVNDNGEPYFKGGRVQAVEIPGAANNIPAANKDFTKANIIATIFGEGEAPPQPVLVPEVAETQPLAVPDSLPVDALFVPVGSRGSLGQTTQAGTNQDRRRVGDDEDSEQGDNLRNDSGSDSVGGGGGTGRDVNSNMLNDNSGLNIQAESTGESQAVFDEYPVIDLDRPMSISGRNIETSDNAAPEQKVPISRERYLALLNDREVFEKLIAGSPNTTNYRVPVNLLESDYYRSMFSSASSPISRQTVDRVLADIGLQIEGSEPLPTNSTETANDIARRNIFLTPLDADPGVAELQKKLRNGIATRYFPDIVSKLGDQEKPNLTTLSNTEFLIYSQYRDQIDEKRLPPDQESNNIIPLGRPFDSLNRVNNAAA